MLDKGYMVKRKHSKPV